MVSVMIMNERPNPSLHRIPTGLTCLSSTPDEEIYLLILGFCCCGVLFMVLGCHHKDDGIDMLYSAHFRVASLGGGEICSVSFKD